jgi:hypothetical protein
LDEAIAATFDRLPDGDPCNVPRFERFRRFYLDVRRELSESLATAPEPVWVKELAAVGWRLADSEDGKTVSFDHDWLVERLGAKLPPLDREYWTLRGQGAAEGLVADGGLVISFRALRERIRRWERFLAAHPESTYAADVRRELSTDLAILLGGLDNSPVFDDAGVLSSEVRREIEAYLADAEALDRARVRGYYELLRQNRFRDSAAARRYRRAHGLVPALRAD